MKRIILLLTLLSFFGGNAIAPAQSSPAKKQLAAVKASVTGTTRDVEISNLLGQGAERQRAGEREVALDFYRQAAKAGSSEGAYRAGLLAWETASPVDGRARLLRLDSGLRSFYQAATNRHAGACLKLAQAHREGLGVPKNLTRAYAWMVTAKQIDPQTPTEWLDDLVVALNPAAIRAAQEEARQWLAGHWPETVAPEIVQGDARFRINGLTGGAMPIVVINSRTLGVGDSTSVVPLLSGPGKVKVPDVDITCLSIGRDYVLLRVALEHPVILLPLAVR
jgi:hypothetical protein